LNARICQKQTALSGCKTQSGAGRGTINKIDEFAGDKAGLIAQSKGAKV
jgi:hypothetical protein